MVQGSREIKGTVERPGIGNTGLLRIPHDTVNVPGMILIIGGTGEVYAGPER
jgi:hypothetical protein